MESRYDTQSFYCASDRPLTILDFKDYPDGHCALLIEGSIAGEVSRVGICRNPRYVSDEDCVQNWTQMALCRDAGATHLDHAVLQEAFARTLCGDRPENQNPRQTRQRGCSSKCREPDANRNYPEACLDMSMIRNTSTMFRNFFLTSSGQMGLEQPPICPGDKVCILSGGEMPFVLRDFENGKFSLVGPAYVDGIMDGEPTKVEGFEESLRIFEIF
jgi:hypothetical protein